MAVAALLMALPAPALAAPAEASPAVSGAVVLDWIQGLLARLGVFGVPSATPPDGPTSVQQRLGSDMEPNGAVSTGTEYDGLAGERLFLGADMEPNG